LRAGLVNNLIDYPWSSYPVYAYNKGRPEWLDTALILSQFNGKNKRQGYRQRVQQYSDEKTSIWDDVRHGLFFGTQGFIDLIRHTHPKAEPNGEILQQRQVLNDRTLGEFLGCGAEILGCDLVKLKQTRRITNSDKTNRDLLIYLLWQTGRFTNSRIGEPLGLTHSSVTRRVHALRERLERDDEVKSRYEKVKSQIKV
jgi:hypothetical protein